MYKEYIQKKLRTRYDVVRVLHRGSHSVDVLVCNTQNKYFSVTSSIDDKQGMTDEQKADLFAKDILDQLYSLDKSFFERSDYLTYEQAQSIAHDIISGKEVGVKTTKLFAEYFLMTQEYLHKEWGINKKCKVL